MNLQQISLIPAGYSEVCYKNKKYGIIRTDFVSGRSTKIYAEELGGNDHISFNFYRTENGGLLKTCEMSEKKVLDFLARLELIDSYSDLHMEIQGRGIAAVATLPQ